MGVDNPLHPINFTKNEVKWKKSKSQKKIGETYGEWVSTEHYITL